MRRNYIGMFDTCKGAFVLILMLGHTISLYSVPADKVPAVASMLFMGLYVLINEGINVAFYIISGYGFRKMQVAKCARQQTGMVVRPYLEAAACTVILHLIARWILFRSARASAKATIHVLLGFLLALPTNITWHGYTIYTCGAMWYVIALMLGWILLDVVENHVPERYVPAALIALLAIACTVSRFVVIPYCICQAAVAAFYIYLGRQIKTRKFLFTDWGKTHWALILMCAVELAASAVTGQMTNIADGVYPLWIASVLLDGGIGTLAVWWFIHIDGIQGPVMDTLRRVGRNSLLIVEVHTMEMIGLPWYLFAERMQNHPIIGCLMQYAIRVCIVWCGYQLMTKARALTKKA